MTSCAVADTKPQAGPQARLYYVHDPMCSWCWAYRPCLLELRERLPADITWQNVLGGLAPDTDRPMPEQTRRMIQDHWRHIEATVGSEFNFEFWTKCQPRRDTYKACRAVIAAANQGAEEAMIESIQRAYYLRAMNPSEPETLADLALELQMNREVFIQDLNSERTENELRRQFELRDRLRVNRFPSLVLCRNSVCSVIRHDYRSAQTSLEAIQRCLNTGAQSEAVC